MTDLLGTCTAWGDGVCVVAPDRGGDPVTIALAEIVSGKPVPPRASPRLRVSPREAQLRALSLWADLETEPLGDWLLRRSAGSANRRANSALAMAPAPPDALAAVVGWYERHGQRPIAAVLAGSEEETAFRGHGWVAESRDEPTVFELASVATVARALPRGLAPATLVEDGHLVTARVGETASGVAALDPAGEWIGFRSIEVDPAHRRRGLGLAVVGALLGWGAERGATTAYLQVLGDNAPALALYERLGFVEHHRYTYLAPPLP